MNGAYAEFLRRKFDFARAYGFAVTDDEIHPSLLRHQRDITRWAVGGGRRAIFAAFGLGKTRIQLETLRLTLAHSSGQKALIVCPLGVRSEFAREAAAIGQQVTFIRTPDRISGPGIYITNYESVRDGKLDPNLFDAVSLDEAACLRSFGSLTYQTFLTLFDGVPHRFVATATPSPNRYKELIHYAGFLGIMSTAEALTRFFQRDSTKANNLTLHPHKVKEFHLWLATWAAFVQKPSNICGHPDRCCCDAGYDLPELNVTYHEIAVDHSDTVADRDGQAPLFRGGALSVKDQAREKRSTLTERIEKMMEIIHGVVGSGQDSEPRVLPEASGTSHRSSEGKDGSPLTRGTRRLPEGVLPRESGSAPSEAAGARQEELRCEAGNVPDSVAALSFGDVRFDPGQVRRDAHGAAGLLRDLREPTGATSERHTLSSCGPLPQDRPGEGAALPAVQLGAGRVQGRSGAAAAGDHLSDQIIVWCDLNDEQSAIERALNDAGLTFSSVHGSLTTEEAEARILRWKSREAYALIGKPVMLGQGLNLQQSSKAIFVGVTYRFNDVIQACHRIQRYGQERVCEVHIIHAESEREVVRTLQKKWVQHDELATTMTDVHREHGLNAASITAALTQSIGVDRTEMSGNGWLLAHNDCVPETQAMDDASVGLIITSVPFSNHYQYTPSANDFGHTDNNDHFWAQMDYLTPELLRTLQPGRIYACHVKDRILFGSVTGAGVPTVSPFHAEAIMHGREHGFDYLGMITVVTDVVRENNQTYRLGWTEQGKDGTKMGVGSPEYILLFRKPQSDRTRGYADTPVTKDKANYTRARWQTDAHAFYRSSGNRHLTSEELASLPGEQMSRLFTEQSLRHVYDYEAHVHLGENLEARGSLPATFMCLAPGSHHPDVWHDVNRLKSLNAEQSRRAQALHICPLPFDIVDRLIIRYSNPGDLVFDPFGGLGTVPLRALRLGREGRSVELNPDYFRDSVAYLRAEERKVHMPSLFDLDEAAS